MRSAAANLKRLTLELGGNDLAIVLPDVDPEAVAPQLFWAAFQNNAQFCNSTKRLYVHEDIYDGVLEALVSYAKNVKVGDTESGTQLGPIQNLPQYEKFWSSSMTARRTDTALPSAARSTTMPAAGSSPSRWWMTLQRTRALSWKRPLARFSPSCDGVTNVM